MPTGSPGDAVLLERVEGLLIRHLLRSADLDQQGGAWATEVPVEIIDRKRIRARREEARLAIVDEPVIGIEVVRAVVRWPEMKEPVAMPQPVAGWERRLGEDALLRAVLARALAARLRVGDGRPRDASHQSLNALVALDVDQAHGRAIFRALLAQCLEAFIDLDVVPDDFRRNAL